MRGTLNTLHTMRRLFKPYLAVAQLLNQINGIRPTFIITTFNILHMLAI